MYTAALPAVLGGGQCWQRRCKCTYGAYARLNLYRFLRLWQGSGGVCGVAGGLGVYGGDNGDSKEGEGGGGNSTEYVYTSERLESPPGVAEARSEAVSADPKSIKICLIAT